VNVLPNLKFADNRGYSKNLDSRWIRPRSLFSQFFMGFCSDEPCEFADNRGYLIGSPWIRSRSLFSQIFHGLLFGMDPANVSAKVEVPVREIIAIAVLGWSCEPPI